MAWVFVGGSAQSGVAVEKSPMALSEVVSAVACLLSHQRPTANFGSPTSSRIPKASRLNVAQPTNQLEICPKPLALLALSPLERSCSERMAPPVQLQFSIDFEF